MAEAILSPIFQLALESLRSKIQDEISVMWGVEKDLENLSSTMSAIESAIADAEEKQARNKSVGDWLEKLKHVVYEVDNILDEYAYEAHGWKLQLPTESRRNKQVSNPLSCLNCFKKVAFRRKIGHKIKDVNTRLDKIAEERHRYHFRDVTVPETNELDRRETASFEDGSQVLGREDEKENIIKLLLSSSSSSSSSSSHDVRRDDLFVISIVGFGGLGKTTLARSVYNDENVKKHFQPNCMWVCVSENFEIKSLVKMIIESLTGEKCQELSLDTLGKNLHEKLNGKRFLLVLDDVWNENKEKWDRLIGLLRCGGEGSRMIVTTRSRRASPICVPNTTIDLEGLSENDCWKLFKQWAFRERNEEEHPELITIGHDIAKKCKGVPLMAKTIGGLMHYKRDASEWEVIRDNELWDFEVDGKDILNSLRISYNHLPSYLKQCFVYCSIFPKDYDFEKEKLIKLWMAQGFIPQPSAQSNRQMEDIGNDYFNGLLWRSFFQDVKRDDSGNIRSCKMHDHLHDLAQSIGKNDCFVKQAGKPKEVIPSKVYHSYFAYDLQETPNIPEEMYELYKCRSYLRTLVVFGKGVYDVPNDLFSKLRHLRVLDLSRCKITEIPDSIGNMIHLRYLDLSSTGIQRLPETTCNLWNLQTLKINYCRGLSELPKGLKNMINLRHLEMVGNNRMKCMPSGIGRLTCLQTLPIYIVCREKECGGLGELQDLNLGGTLRIEKLENSRNMEESKKANLKNKKHLHTLHFRWSRGRTINAEEEEEGTLEGLQPHTNLRSLRIVNYGGVMFPSWLSDSSLTNLRSIYLYNCSNCQSLPQLGKLQLLESLTLEDMDDLNDWSTIEESNLSILTINRCEKLRALPKLANLKQLRLSSCDEMVMTLEHLPSLDTLSISLCSNITSLPESLGTLSALRTLIIRFCSKLGSLPEGLKHLSTLECLEIYACPLLTKRCREGGEDWNKIAHIRNKSIKEEWRRRRI